VARAEVGESTIGENRRRRVAGEEAAAAGGFFIKRRGGRRSAGCVNESDTVSSSFPWPQRIRCYRREPSGMCTYLRHFGPGLKRLT
jgi:hypothetical protein